MNKVYSHKHWIAYRKWSAGLPVRDLKALMLLGLFCLMLTGWLVVWKPIRQARQDAAVSYQEAQAGLAWMQAHAGEISPASSASAKARTDAPLVEVASEAAQAHQLVISHAEPGEDATLRVSLDNASFSHVLLWLETMQHQHGIRASQISIAKQAEAGFVNATLTLHSSPF